MALTGDFTFVTFDMLTGENTVPLEVSAQNWQRGLNIAGAIDLTIPSAPKGTLRWAQQRQNITPLKRGVAVIFQGSVQVAGPIQKSKPNPGGATTQILAAGSPKTIFDDRIIFTNDATFPNTGRPTETKVEFKNTTPGNVMSRIVENSLNAAPAGSHLNITTASTAPVTGETSVTYEASSLVRVGAELDKLSSQCDYRFRTYWQDTSKTVIQWAFEVGSPIFTQGTAPDHVFDLTVTNPAVSKLVADEDGTGIFSRVWVPGNGSGKDMALGWANSPKLTDQGYPFTETSKASKRDLAVAVLETEAAQQLQEATSNWRQWVLTTRADRAPLLGTYNEGDFCTVLVPDAHPQVAAGTYRCRIMEINVSGSNTVEITMCPLQDPGSIDPNSVPRRYVPEGKSGSYTTQSDASRLAALENYSAQTGLGYDPTTGELSYVDPSGNSQSLGNPGSLGQAGDLRVNNGRYIMESNIWNTGGDGSPRIDFYPFTTNPDGTGAITPGFGSYLQLMTGADHIKTFSCTGPIHGTNDAVPLLQLGVRDDIPGVDGWKSFATVQAEQVFLGDGTASRVSVRGSLETSRITVSSHSILNGTTEAQDLRATSINIPTSNENPSFISILDADKLNVRGDFTVAGSKQFIMDHPDGSGRKLLHAATESDCNGVEYWGTATTDENGFVDITLPNWFEKLVKKEHRAVIATPISSRTTFRASLPVDGRFFIEADPGVEFSWNAKAERVVLVDGVDTIAFDPERDK